MLRSFLFVGLGGAAGSMARYGVALAVGAWWSGSYPLGTFAINVSGSLLIGLLYGLSTKMPWLQTGGMLLLATGFCGGFTTFSTFAAENVSLLQKGLSGTALAYMIASLVVGLLLCRAGIWLAG